MFIEKEYFGKMRSEELGGILFSWSMGAIELEERYVAVILKILKERDALPQSTAALVEERRKEIKENGPGTPKPIIKLGPHPITFQYTEEP